MVYAGYVPAKLPTVATDLDRAVMAVTQLDTLEILQKLLYNAAISPKEEKYRKIRLSNEKIRSLLVEVPGAVQLLLEMGWVKDEAEDALIIPPGKYMSMKEVRMIEDQKDRARKQVRTQQTEAIRRAGQPSSSTAAV